MRRQRHRDRVEGINRRIRERGPVSERVQRIRERQEAPVDPDAPITVVTCGPVSDETRAALEEVGRAAAETLGAGEGAPVTVLSRHLGPEDFDRLAEEGLDAYA